MIEFRKKKSLIVDLIPEALNYLKKEGIENKERISFNVITPDKAEEASRVNSKAMVLLSFIKNEYGYYQIQIKEKELYRYTQKLIKDIFRMRITSVDSKTKTITAESDHMGLVLDFIEILAMNPKYNLSIVKN